MRQHKEEDTELVRLDNRGITRFMIREQDHVSICWRVRARARLGLHFMLLN